MLQPIVAQEKYIDKIGTLIFYRDICKEDGCFKKRYFIFQNDFQKPRLRIRDTRGFACKGNVVSVSSIKYKKKTEEKMKTRKMIIIGGALISLLMLLSIVGAAAVGQN